MTISLVTKPTDDIDKVNGSVSLISMEKLPVLSVTVPSAVFFIATLASGIPLPEASLTDPEMVTDWENTGNKTVVSMNTSNDDLNRMLVTERLQVIAAVWRLLPSLMVTDGLMVNSFRTSWLLG